ncbi:MBOAT family O-acyltransferase [Sporanaerobacter acetigenes]|uniref:Alginate O-acetyltransferase complex protein AlgI n=1 Tax=Sporanaerobacter acetigenes DSM 13106 TaxID=1123281 RepID=A0A1M5SGL2_9FIRM|nr:alginate O-acetyltransferase complex protein AlgI [Sporanaerobacter acetigenes DSM 13106]
MVFSSLIFLFLFLPVVLVCYYLSGNRFRNYILLGASLFFYAWGEPRYIYLMLFSIVINYFIGLKMDISSKSNKKLLLLISIIFNLSLLIIFKYADFLFGIKGIRLPLGISFYTFQIMSYVIDVYRKDAEVQRNIFDLALYVSLFPQLVAGPIVRYQTVVEQISIREYSLDKFADGVNRFVLGLSKKVILANQLALVADGVFIKNVANLSIVESWIGIVCYTFQIYFDFSGYSDMAIGLGKMFGFDFLENFDYPYISQSVSEFWRRWHISLGSWFRDYVYIPLGGNRVSKFRLYMNVLVVWCLTGLWHGANWTFVVWGLYYGVFLILEKAFLEKALKKLPKILRHVYLLLVVIIGWVFFRADNIVQGIDFIKVMMGFGTSPITNNSVSIYINDYWYIIVAAAIFSTPIMDKFKRVILRNNKNLLENGVVYKLQSLILIICMFIVIVLLTGSSYNPFLYFRF